MNLNEKLQLILNKFKENVKPEQFQFDSFVAEAEGGCGTTCCILGWFPKLFPNSGFFWIDKPNGNNQLILTHASDEDPQHAVINLLRCDKDLVGYLFYGFWDGNPRVSQFPRLTEISDYQSVIQAWETVIASDLKKYEIVEYSLS